MGKEEKNGNRRKNINPNQRVFSKKDRKKHVKRQKVRERIEEAS